MLRRPCFDDLTPAGLTKEQCWNALGKDDRGRIHIGFTSMRTDSKESTPCRIIAALICLLSISPPTKWRISAKVCPTASGQHPKSHTPPQHSNTKPALSLPCYVSYFLTVEIWVLALDISAALGRLRFGVSLPGSLAMPGLYDPIAA